MVFQEAVSKYKEWVRSGKFWRICSWLALALLIFQITYFLILYIPELQERWIDIMPLMKMLFLTVLITLLFLLLYRKVFSKNSIVKKLGVIFYRLLLSLYLLQWFFVALYGIINPPITFTQIGSIFSGYGLQRDYVSYDNINMNMKLAVLASEDQLFTDHDGFDIKAIKLALKYNKRHPKRTKGASTISQQTAKNLFLWQTRNFIRKGLEVYFTFMIETFWTKKKILTRYLNIIETGPGIFGVQAAAQSYFNKSAKDLTRSESAMIAAGLPNPKRYTVKPMSNYIRSRYDDILNQMNNIEPDPDIQELIQ